MLCCCKEQDSPPPSKKIQHAQKESRRAQAPSSKSPNRTDAPKRGTSKSPSREERLKQNTASIVTPDSVILTEKGAHSGIMANLEALVSRLEAVTTRLEGVASGAGATSGAAAGETSPFVLAYDEILNGPFRQFRAASEKIGGDVNTIVANVASAFTAQRAFLVAVSRSKQPDQGALQKALQPTSEFISQVQSYRENNRKSQFFNHLSAMSESITALAWVTVSPAPAPFVKEMCDAGQFYTNRVLKEYKDKDKNHVDWVKMWVETLKQLQAYVKQHHTTGVSWNPKGGDIAGAAGAVPPPPPPAAGGPPPPPPPPPAVEAPAGGGGEDTPGRAALFADLNKGTDVTKGLKKVTDDMKTHKNPALRTGPQPFKASPHASPKPYKAPAAVAPAAPVSKPAVCKLENKKWIVEYQNGNKNLILAETNMKQTVYIYRCVDSTVQVKGKVNSIIVDSCKKTGIVFESVVSVLDFVNCQSVQGQVMGQVPTVSIDKTDGCQVYLSKDSVNAEIITAKSSEMNILIPDSSGEFKEFAIPEQFKTRYNGKKLVTEASDSLG